MLNDRVQKRVLRRNAHFPRIDLYVLNILLIDFVAIFRQHDASAVIKALNMRPGDSDVNAADHDIAFLFGIDHCFVHAFHRRLEINDLAFAHTARGAWPTPRILIVPSGRLFPDDHANFRGANLKTDHQIIARHFVNPFLSCSTGNCL